MITLNDIFIGVMIVLGIATAVIQVTIAVNLIMIVQARHARERGDYDREAMKHVEERARFNREYMNDVIAAKAAMEAAGNEQSSAT